jgi:hypothetical protein
VLRGLDTLPIHAPYHTIVGDRGRGDTPNSSDGVVAYWSSHLAGAQSELIVPGPHGSYALPQTVTELKRILRLNLAAVSTPHRNTMSKSSERAGRSSSRDQSLTVGELSAPSPCRQGTTLFRALTGRHPVISNINMQAFFARS